MQISDQGVGHREQLCGSRIAQTVNDALMMPASLNYADVAKNCQLA
jgi:hypothetical protein